MNRDESKPIYLKIREDLLRDLEHNCNKKLPSEQELCRRYNVCRTTVHKAFEYFLENNMIVRRAGKGTFFRDEVLQRRAAVKRVWGVIRRDWETWDTDYYFCSVIQGLMSALGPECQLSLEQYSETLLYKLLSDRDAASVWISPEAAEIAAMRQIANCERMVVAINRQVSCPGIRSVSIDHRAAGELAAREFAGAGHRRICAVYLESEQAFFGQMREGLDAAVCKDNLPLEVHEEMIPQNNWHHGSRLQFNRLLSRGETVFFIHTTSMVPPFLEELEHLGLLLGRDVYLLVYGDSFQFERDQVTALRQPGMILGNLAGKVALGIESGSEYLLKELDLVRRGSLYQLKDGAADRSATDAVPGVLSPQE